MELTDNLKKCMSPESRKQYGRAGRTNEEHEANACVKLEKELHNQYIGFLRRHGLEYIHAPMHKKSALPEGWPDFTVFGHGGNTMFMEFKLYGKYLSDQQIGRIQILQAKSFPALVAFTFQEAMIATKEFFQL